MTSVSTTPQAHPASLAPVVQSVLDELGQQPGALLPVLHAVQDRLGHVPSAAVPLIAQSLNLSTAEVHGVVSYYHHFRAEPALRVVVQICRAESCQAQGGEALWSHACQAHGQAVEQGLLGFEPVYCLGLCASSPAMAVNERVHARLTPDRLDQVVTKALQAAATVEVAP
jgi:NADH:ubiquinone oxidoreductase subunit E